MTETNANPNGKKEQMTDYVYRGYFVNKDNLDRKLADAGINLPNLPEDWNLTKNSHITTSFQKEAAAEWKDIGTHCDLNITGYGYDKNKALALTIEPKETQEGNAFKELEATGKLRQLHITIGVAPGIKNKQSAELFEENSGADIVKFDKPIEISAVYGGCIKDSGKIDTTSYTNYIKTKERYSSRAANAAVNIEKENDLQNSGASIV